MTFCIVRGKERNRILLLSYKCCLNVSFLSRSPSFFKGMSISLELKLNKFSSYQTKIKQLTKSFEKVVWHVFKYQNLSGIQTLGAETLLEIWLRELKSTNTLDKEVKAEVEIMKKPEIPTKIKTNLMARSEELMDDNLLDFLNKIESSPCSISADIEKIQPTVMVTEHLGVKLKTPSPEKCKVFSAVQPISPIKMPPLLEISKNPEKSLEITPTIIPNTMVEVAKIPEKSLALTTTSNTTTVSAPTPITTVAVTAEFKTPPLFTNGSLTTKPMTTFVRIPTSSTQVRFINSSSTVANNIPPLRPLTPSPLTSTTPAHSLTSTITQKTMILNKDGKIRMPSASVASAVRRTILPIVNSTQANIPSKPSQFPNANKPQIVSVSSSTTITSSAPKQILQKKLVQLVDSTGKVKYIQMLVAASSASSSMHNLSTSSSVAPKLITMAPSSVKNNTG